MSEHWSLGWLIGMPTWVVLSTILGLFAVGSLFVRDDGYGEKWFYFFGIGACWAFVFVLGLALLWPLQTQYHKWIPHGGTVSEVNKRLVSDGDKGMSEKIVVLFKDDPQEYGCEDTRCSLAKPGDHVDLSCIKEWQWAGTDGFNCKFVKRVPA